MANESVPSLHASVFDLRRDAEQYDTLQLLPRRAMLLLAVGFGGFLIAAGIGLWLTLLQTVGLPSVIVVIVIGALVSGVGLASYPQSPAVAVRLTVDDGGIELLSKKGSSLRISWSNYDHRVVIADVRSVPVERKGRAFASLQYVLMPSGLPISGPISEGAVLQIMDSARKYGLEVHGWSPTPNVLGRQVRIAIVPRGLEAQTT